MEFKLFAILHSVISCNLLVFCLLNIYNDWINKTMAINWRNLEREQTPQEERINSGLHVIGTVLAFIGLIYLIIHGFKEHNLNHFLGFFLYGVSLVLLFTMSSLYHGIQRKRIKAILALLDYSAIYILIAGSYTPVFLIIFEKHILISWGLFITAWIIAITGVIATLFWVRQIGIMSLIAYAITGLVSLAFIPAVYRIMGLEVILYAALGGVMYLIGVYFFGIAKFRYHHAIWHSFVLAGTFIHFFTINRFL